MSGIGFWELIILFLIGLVVLGPERLPRVANQLGSWLGQARRMTRVMRRQLEEELDLDNKLKIRPTPPIKPKKDKDDTYSPAHAPDGVGTGVGDDETAEEAPQNPGEPDTAGADDAEKETT
jgi:Tat protein translocase TatB subunit